jgi:hypothetical protein
MLKGYWESDPDTIRHCLSRGDRQQVGREREVQCSKVHDNIVLVWTKPADLLYRVGTLSELLFGV